MESIIKPSTNLYGVTHSPNGEPRIIEPKTVKVGIGLAKGKAIHAYIDLNGKWVIVSGYGDNAVRERLDDKREAQKKYRELKKTAPDRRYPERLPYFTFSHVSASGDFEPDWDVIESHGSVPTEIDIIFVRDDPFTAAYQMWTATEKKCSGDGKVALRVNSIAATPEEKRLAEEAETRGERVYPVTGCALGDCKYSKPSDNKPAACRPMARLFFQLLNSPRLGGTAVFNTAGYKSISQIFSSLEIFKRATGRGDPKNGFVAGIPLKMVLRPYRVTYGGRTATQYAVALEFRAESALALKQSLVEQAVKYRIAGSEPLKQLEQADLPDPDIKNTQEPDENPAAIAAEFEPQASEEAPEIEPELEEAPSPAWTQRASETEIQNFYDLCRSRGMNDTDILNYLGSMGFEELKEITVKALPKLMAWARDYKNN